MQTPWDNRYAQRTQRMKGSAIRELLKVSEEMDIISFAGGFPAPESFPVDEFKTACDNVLTELGPQSLQYHSTEGYRPLRDLIARYMGRYKIEIATDNILITAGSQQALDLIGKCFINRGDRILVENPTYLGALQAWSPYGAEYIMVNMDEDGMKTDELENAFRSGPKFIYTVPNFQNPTGVTMSLERRQQLVKLASVYGIPIVEDDPYGQIRYEGDSLPSLVVLDSQINPNSGSYNGNVLYLSTFSKVLAPGIRVGSVIAPPEVIQKLVIAKQSTDLQVSTFNQMVAYEISHGGFIDKHIIKIRKINLERRDVMLEALAKEMPSGVKWTHPQGGLFLWVTLPNGIKSKDVFTKALVAKVAFVSGESFFPYGGGENTMRLNFSNARPEMIREGIKRLGKVLRSLIK
jgi:2-aminoadipate transaminase